MTTKQRILMGALGGITPYLVTLLSIDFKAAVLGYEFLDWVGLGVRCVVLIFLGSLVAYLHHSEKEAFKVFQLGLAAPALLATFINGNAGNNQVLPTAVGSAAVTFTLVAEAHAQEPPFVNQGLLRAPKVSAFSRFMRGVLGTRLKTSEKEVYFVIVGSHKERSAAQRQVDLLEEKHYAATVLERYGLSEYYAVVIASNVTREEAERIREQAIADGLPQDSFIWTY